MTDTRPLATVNGYQGLVAAIRARKEALHMSDTDLEEIAGLTRGHVSKLLAPGATKTLGPLSMGRLLRALGLDLIVTENASQTAKIRDLYTERDEAQVRKRAVMAIAISEPPPWLLNRERARELRQKQLSTMSREQRKRIARKAWRSRRRNRKQRGMSHAAANG